MLVQIPAVLFKCFIRDWSVHAVLYFTSNNDQEIKVLFKYSLCQKHKNECPRRKPCTFHVLKAFELSYCFPLMFAHTYSHSWSWYCSKQRRDSSQHFTDSVIIYVMNVCLKSDKRCYLLHLSETNLDYIFICGK